VQNQALDRTQPLLPMRPGQVERHTHDYKRHGTTSLFAALDVKAGTVIGKCMPRHRAQEFRRFPDTVEGAVPVDLDIHIVMDNAFFALLTEQQIRRGAHRSTKALEAAIAAYIDTRNADPQGHGDTEWNRCPPGSASERMSLERGGFQARCLCVSPVNLRAILYFPYLDARGSVGE
jgi:DDE superfamily endonuclease